MRFASPRYLLLFTRGVYSPPFSLSLRVPYPSLSLRCVRVSLFLKVWSLLLLRFHVPHRALGPRCGVVSNCGVSFGQLGETGVPRLQSVSDCSVGVTWFMGGVCNASGEEGIEAFIVCKRLCPLPSPLYATTHRMRACNKFT